MPKKTTSAPQPERSDAQLAAAKYNEAAGHREPSHSPRRPVAERTPLLTFTVVSPKHESLELTAEDESEAIRAFRHCHGIQAASITCRASLVGDDPRPQPQHLAT